MKINYVYDDDEISASQVEQFHEWVDIAASQISGEPPTPATGEHQPLDEIYHAIANDECIVTVTPQLYEAMHHRYGS